MASGRRWLAGPVAAALLLLTGLATPTGPAAAADAEPKFSFDLTGTTIALGVQKKRVHLRMTNLTDETPSVVQFNVYSDELDWLNKASLNWPEGGGSGECDGDTPGWYCQFSSAVHPELLPAPGATVDLPIDIRVREDQEPYEGRFRIEAAMSWGTDVEWIKSSKWFTLRLVDEPEADLSVVAPDVTQSVRIGAGGRLEPAGTLKPGESGAVRYRVVNHGRKAVSGVKATLRLPAGVTFTRPPKECVIDDNGRSAECTYDTLALAPAEQDTDPNDGIHSAVELHNLVLVSADTKAPVTLDGATVRVEGLTAEPLAARSGPERTELPVNAVAVPAADVDASDNEDGFAVVVAASGGDGGDDGGNGGGGGLPVTGSQVGLIAGAGLALVLGGGLMLLVARRRNRLPFVG
ncbi:LPXTG cell wall anchor domain-containing protein [Micromonospora radicis]|uniref:LPXTG cell wall anchor domain-containing protein n=1 Tax=Micromonospora radicis TaxID=1894971 RepID=A0A418MRG4_9ACTN|nr:LPXTG cell wall anchor domain-containing protein [Micromonospora radicis]RIV36432.1 LPXTG cell wall anchor domain-containing protein [Micromonospora radicis]